MSSRSFSMVYGIMMAIMLVSLLITHVRYKQEREKMWKLGAACLFVFIIIDSILHALTE